MLYSTNQLRNMAADLYEIAEDVSQLQEDTDWDKLSLRLTAIADEIKKQTDDDYIEKLQERVATLFDAIQHGSPKHRTWLMTAIENHFAGRPIQKPVG